MASQNDCIPADITNTIPADIGYDTNNLPPEAATFAIEPRLTIADRHLATENNSPIPTNIASNVSGWEIHVFQCRGYTIEQIAQRVHPDHWFKISSGSLRGVKNALSMRAQRFRARMGILDAVLRDPENYDSNQKGFHTNAARVGRLTDIQLLYNVVFDVHPNGTMSQPWVAKKGLPSTHNPPSNWIPTLFPLPAPRQVTERVAKLCNHLGRRIPNLSDLPALQQQMNWQGPLYSVPAQASLPSTAEFVTTGQGNTIFQAPPMVVAPAVPERNRADDESNVPKRTRSSSTLDENSEELLEGSPPEPPTFRYPSPPSPSDPPFYLDPEFFVSDSEQ